MMNNFIYCPTIAAAQGPLSGALIVTALPPVMVETEVVFVKQI